MRREILICLLLLTATLAVYWPVQNHDFLEYDDHEYITTNPYVKAGLSSEGILWAFSTGHVGNWHPVTWLSHMLDCELYGLNPRGHHLTNVIFHMVNSVLLFLVLRLMTGAVWRSGLVAALFALHPLHVESVAWVSERKDVLSTLFWLLTMWAYCGFARRSLRSRYLLALLCFMLGLMAKSMLVTLPFVLLLLDYWPLERLGLKRSAGRATAANQNGSQYKELSRQVRCLLWEKVPFFVLSAVICVVTFSTQKSGGGVKSFELVPLQGRIANAVLSYVKYISKMIWPQDLAALYPLPLDGPPMWQVPWAALLLLFITLVAIKTIRRHPYVSVGWFWYLGTLVPVIGLVQVGPQAMADRYTYIPLIGLFIVVSWGVHHLATLWPRRKSFLVLLTAVLLVALMIRTHQQLRHWRTTSTVFLHTLDVIDTRSLGDLLKYDVFTLDEAIAHYSEPGKLKPDHAIAHNILGINLVNQGRIEEAISQFTQALKIDPHYALAHNNLGALHARAGRLDEAVYHYSEALRLEPEHAKAHNNLGEVLHRQGRFDEAASHFSRALRTDPDYAEAHHNLGIVLAGQGRLDEAIAQLSQAIESKPDYPEAHNSLGIVLARQGNLDQAIDHFSEALRLKPDYKQARTNLEFALRDAGQLKGGSAKEVRP
jgi:tetratricopeptide (TPR) repeat protein